MSSRRGERPIFVVTDHKREEPWIGRLEIFGHEIRFDISPPQALLVRQSGPPSLQFDQYPVNVVSHGVGKMKVLDILEIGKPRPGELGPLGEYLVDVFDRNFCARAGEENAAGPAVEGGEPVHESGRQSASALRHVSSEGVILGALDCSLS